MTNNQEFSLEVNPSNKGVIYINFHQYNNNIIPLDVSSKTLNFSSKSIKIQNEIKALNQNKDNKNKNDTSVKAFLPSSSESTKIIITALPLNYEKYSYYSLKGKEVTQSDVDAFEIILSECDQEKEVDLSDNFWEIDENKAIFHIKIKKIIILKLVDDIHSGISSANISLIVDRYFYSDKYEFLIAKSHIEPDEHVAHEITHGCSDFDMSYTSKSFKIGEFND